MNKLTIQNTPPTISWIGATALAVGGANLGFMIMISGGLFANFGTAMILVIFVGLITAWLAAPGWLKLLLSYPSKVGGIVTVSAVTLRPYSQLLGTIVAIGYWFGWAITPSFAALYVALAVKEYLAPHLSIHILATFLTLLMTAVSLLGLRWVARIIIPLAIFAAIITLTSGLLPLFAGTVNWTQAFDFKLITPFPGWFGVFTSIMAGLYLVGWITPIFEASTCFVGKMINPKVNVPRALIATILLNAFALTVIPIVWLGTLGPDALNKMLSVNDLSKVFGALGDKPAHLLAFGFFFFNALSTTLAPLVFSPLVLSQLSDDGFIPKIFGKRLAYNDVPWVATLTTSGVAILNMVMGDPIWVVAAANFEYIICLGVASIAAYLLWRSSKDKPTSAYYGTTSSLLIKMGLVAAIVWIVAAIFGFQQFGLPRIIAGIAFAFAGGIFLVWRQISDRVSQGLPWVSPSLQLKLTGTMILILFFDATGYLIAVGIAAQFQAGTPMIVVLEDIFVLVTIITITVGLVVPGIVVTAAENISYAAKNLAEHILSDFSKAIIALGRGDLESAQVDIRVNPLPVYSNDEVGNMAVSFNRLQTEIVRSVQGLRASKEKLQRARQELIDINADLENRVKERTQQLTMTNEALTKTLEDLTLAKDRLVETEKLVALGELVVGVAHEVSTPLGIAVTAMSQLKEETEGIDKLNKAHQLTQSQLNNFLNICEESETLIINNLKRATHLMTSFKEVSADRASEISRSFKVKPYLREVMLSLKPVLKKTLLEVEIDCPDDLEIYSYPGVIFQIITIFVMNSIMHGFSPEDKGKITIQVSIKNNNVILVYADNGCGIPPENLKKVFEPFFTTKRGSGGIGLGLHILFNRVVQVLNGTVICESTLGHGVKFTITFPTQA